VDALRAGGDIDQQRIRVSFRNEPAPCVRIRGGDDLDAIQVTPQISAANFSMSTAGIVPCLKASSEITTAALLTWNRSGACLATSNGRDQASSLTPAGTSTSSISTFGWNFLYCAIASPKAFYSAVGGAPEGGMPPLYANDTLRPRSPVADHLTGALGSE